MSVHHLSTFVISTFAVVLALLGLCLASPGVAYADDITVCKAGPPTCDYAVIQDAVDVASRGDVIKVATGVYTGVSGRAAPPGYLGPSVITQVVYLSKLASSTSASSRIQVPRSSLRWSISARR